MGILLALTVYLLQFRLVYSDFQQLEEGYARTNVDQVIGRLDVALETIDFTVYDWSAWDDTYQFAEDRNTDYVESNLYAYTFYNLRTDVVLFIDNTMDVLWAGTYEFMPEYGIEEHTLCVNVVVATIIPDEILSLQSLVLAADQALYRAKSNGRACVAEGVAG